MPLALVLAAASWLRLYNLGTPSMWLDEILVPMAAAHPLDYIFDLCRNIEVHPPGYYLLVKAVLGADTSDFALRILSALCGIWSVHLTYVWVRELSGRPEGLLAAAFMAVNTLHVYDSRVVRPYSVFLALLLLGLVHLFRFLRAGGKRDLLYFSLSNAALVVIHYAALMFTAAAGLLLAKVWHARRRSLPLRDMASYPLAMGGAFVAILPFFLGRLEKTHKGQFMGFDFLAATSNTLTKLSEVVSMHQDWPVRALLVLLVLAGLARMVCKGGSQGRAVAWLALAPVVMLLATKYDYYAYNVWHLSFLLPFFACMAGHSLWFLKPRAVTAAAVALAVVGGWYLADRHHDRYYRQDSAILPFFILGKPAARELAGRLVPGDLAAVTDFSIFNALSWYIDQFAAVNPLKNQSLPAGGGAVTLRYVSGLGQFGGLAKNEEEFLSKMGKPHAVEKLGQLKVYTFQVEREPAPRIGSLPGKATVQAGLKEFYAKAERLENLTYDGNWGGAFCPVEPARKAEAAFRVDNATGPGPQLVTLGMRYVNEGRGNTLKMFYRFDDEAERPILASHGPDGSTMDLAIIERASPWQRLSIRLEMHLAPLTARFPGGNQETLGLKEVFVRAEALE